MKRIIFVCVLISGLISTSCKKKDTTPAPAPVNTTPPADGTASSATQYYGIFTTGSYTTIIGANTYTNFGARAYFSNQAVPGMDISTSILINKLYLNGDTLNYFSSYKYYTTYNPVNLATETWSVIGANGIGTFSFTNNTITPSCTGYNTLPDSVSKSVGFTVSINNVTNSSSGSLLIFDGTGNLSGYYSVGLNAGTNAITVTPANLTSLSTTTNGNIAVSLSNNKAYYFSGKSFEFSREAQYTKYIKIKP